MPSRIVVPELGESVVEATVGHWLKHEGDRVSVGETLVSLETDKVDLEVAAERNGVLTRVERKEGEDVKIGDVLGVIEDAVGEAAVPAPAPSEPGAGGGGGDTAATGVGAPKPSPSATVSSEVIFSGPTVLSPSGPSEKGAGGEGATPSARRAAREREVEVHANALKRRSEREEQLVAKFKQEKVIVERETEGTVAEDLAKEEYEATRAELQQLLVEAKSEESK